MARKNLAPAGSGPNDPAARPLIFRRPTPVSAPGCLARRGWYNSKRFLPKDPPKDT